MTLLFIVFVWQEGMEGFFFFLSFLIVVFPLTVSSIFELFFISLFLLDQIWETGITKGLAPSLCHQAKQSEKWERPLLAIT